jgi:hypothetical protein
MKPTIYFVLSLLMVSTTIAAAPTTVNVGGRTIRNVVGVSLNPNGTVGIVSGSAVLSFQLKDVPSDFLTAWEISPEQIILVEKTAQSVIEADQQKEREVTQAKIITDAKRPLKITPETRGGITLSHFSSEQLKNDLRSRLLNLNTPEDRITAALSQVPLGGTVKAYIERSTIGAANTEYFTFIVFDASGREVLRHVGSDDIANVPSGSSDMWWNIELFNLPGNMQRPLIIRAVDTLMNKSYEFRAE